MKGKVDLHDILGGMDVYMESLTDGDINAFILWIKKRDIRWLLCITE